MHALNSSKQTIKLHFLDVGIVFLTYHAEGNFFPSIVNVLRSMISIPGSLFFVMSSAPAKKYAGDVRCASLKIHPSTATLSHTISTQVRIRSAFFLRPNAIRYLAITIPSLHLLLLTNVRAKPRL